MFKKVKLFLKIVGFFGPNFSLLRHAITHYATRVLFSNITLLCLRECMFKKSKNNGVFSS
jgi:hypothetical protein